MYLDTIDFTYTQHQSVVQFVCNINVHHYILWFSHACHAVLSVVTACTQGGLSDQDWPKHTCTDHLLAT